MGVSVIGNKNRRLFATYSFWGVHFGTRIYNQTTEKTGLLLKRSCDSVDTTRPFQDMILLLIYPDDNKQNIVCSM